MNIQHAKQEIVNTIRAYTVRNEWGGYVIPSLRQRPLLLIGPPGIGKTAIMAQAASECQVGFVAYTMTHHTRQSAMGLPFINRQTFGDKEYSITDYTMSEIIASVYRTIEETGCREGLLFLDEINCVSETLAPAMLQFLQTKTFGSHRLPDGWILAAAGNPPEYNKSVRDFDIATLDRLKYITIEADYDAWRSYALDAGIHGAILSYLDTRPEQFYVLQQTYASRSFATARGWEDLSCILLQYEELSIPVDTDLIHQYLHSDELSQDFSSYYHWYVSKEGQINIAALLSGQPESASACREVLLHAPFDEQLQLVHRILSCINTKIQQWNGKKEEQSAFTELSDRFKRFSASRAEHSFHQTLSEFISNEQNILNIRQEHGLSSEHEIRKMAKTLHLLQNAASTHGNQDDLLFEKERALICQHSAEAADKLTSALLYMMDLFSGLPSDKGTVLSLLLSSLQQITQLKSFLLEHPCTAFEEQCKRLDFAGRRETLRQEIQSHILTGN